MLYTRKSTWTRLRRSRAGRAVTAIAAGIHTGHGLAHGVPAPPQSAARRTHDF
ncbi:hypothetical protein [Mycolicibacterium gilvum]|uniref:hypothetical protein n=1 Tax=Mycolicibacterium gilvum TaxID=1804 RepID=UPI0013010257|nr:hypothetical protein [Mycolicibacterium gilvum]